MEEKETGYKVVCIYFVFAIVGGTESKPGFLLLIVLLLGNKPSNPEQKVKFNCTEKRFPRGVWQRLSS